MKRLSKERGGRVETLNVKIRKERERGGRGIREKYTAHTCTNTLKY